MLDQKQDEKFDKKQTDKNTHAEIVELIQSVVDADVIVHSSRLIPVGTQITDPIVQACIEANPDALSNLLVVDVDHDDALLAVDAPYLPAPQPEQGGASRSLYHDDRGLRYTHDGPDRVPPADTSWRLLLRHR